MTVHEPANLSKRASDQAFYDYWHQAKALLASATVPGSSQRAALIVFSIRMASAAIAYASQVLLARWMGGFEYGIFVFVWVWVLILGGLSPIGFSTATVRFIPEYLENGRNDLLRGLLRVSRLAALGVSSLVALSGLVMLGLFGDAVEPIYLLPASLILICIPLYALMDIQDGLCRGFGWINIALVPPYILRPLMILATFGGALAFGFEPTALTAAGAAVVSAWASVMLQWLAFERRVTQEIKPAKACFKTRLWIATALPMLLFHGFELLL